MGSKITGERRRIPLRLQYSKGLSASTKAHFRKPKTVPMPVPRGCVGSHPLLPRVIMTEREHRSTKTGCISLASNAENLMKWTLFFCFVIGAQGNFLEHLPSLHLPFSSFPLQVHGVPLHRLELSSSDLHPHRESCLFYISYQILVAPEISDFQSRPKSANISLMLLLELLE